MNDIDNGKTVMASELELWPYSQTFNAIAAATWIEGGCIFISVEKFAEAFGPRPAPAATDTGMETFSVEKTSSGHPYMKSDPDGDYVTRSQAVELLAAERSAIPILKGTAYKSGDGWKDTTKEGEVCFVWNKMLPAPFASGQYSRIGKEHWRASTENFTFEPATPDEVVELFSSLKADNAAKDSRIKELEAKLETWKEALRASSKGTAILTARVKTETELRKDHQERNIELEAKLAAAGK